jgi:hypothetical protein
MCLYAIGSVPFTNRVTPWNSSDRIYSSKSMQYVSKGSLPQKNTCWSLAGDGLHDVPRGRPLSATNKTSAERQ